MYQRGPAVRPPIGIAFDGDLGNRIDAILAVAMLNGLTAKTEARSISLSVSRPSLASARHMSEPMQLTLFGYSWMFMASISGYSRCGHRSPMMPVP